MTGGLWCESDVRERICAAVLRDPPGKSAKPCPAPPRKIIRFPCRANHLYKLAPSCPTEGRLEIVTDAGQDAVDAECAFDEWRVRRTAKACGPDAPMLASSSREASFSGMTVAKKPVAGESTKEAVKPLRGECRVIPV